MIDIITSYVTSLAPSVMAVLSIAAVGVTIIKRFKKTDGRIIEQSERMSTTRLEERVQAQTEELKQLRLSNKAIEDKLDRLLERRKK